MTDKVIVNPFKNVDDGDLIQKIKTYKDQGGFLHEQAYKLVRHNRLTDEFVFQPDSEKLKAEIEIQDFEIEKDNKTYVCRTYTISYTAIKYGCFALNDNDTAGRSFRLVDTLVIGPQELTANMQKLPINYLFEHYTLFSHLNIEIHDLNPHNKSVALNKNQEIVDGYIARDVNKIPVSFFLKEPETFTIKIQAIEPGKKPIMMTARLGYLSYSDVGLN